MKARELYFVGVALILTYGLFRGIQEVYALFLLGFFALLLAMFLNFPIRFFSRWMPRGVAIPLVLLLVGGIATGMGFLTVPLVVQEGRQALKKLP